MEIDPFENTPPPSRLIFFLAQRFTQKCYSPGTLSNIISKSFIFNIQLSKLREYNEHVFHSIMNHG